MAPAVKEVKEAPAVGKCDIFRCKITLIVEPG